MTKVIFTCTLSVIIGVKLPHFRSRELIRQFIPNLAQTLPKGTKIKVSTNENLVIYDYPILQILQHLQVYQKFIKQKKILYNIFLMRDNHLQISDEIKVKNASQ